MHNSNMHLLPEYVRGLLLERFQFVRKNSMMTMRSINLLAAPQCPPFPHVGSSGLGEWGQRARYQLHGECGAGDRLNELAMADHWKCRKIQLQQQYLFWSQEDVAKS